jgi:hypothetical protein
MQLYELYVPIVADKTRKPHSIAAWQMLENYLLDYFGGFTRLPSVDGKWKDNAGRVIADRSYVYSVAIEPTSYSLLVALVEIIKQRFDQQCIFVACVGSAELL